MQFALWKIKTANPLQQQTTIKVLEYGVTCQAIRVIVLSNSADLMNEKEF
jgi:hypothetical protein